MKRTTTPPKPVKRKPGPKSQCTPDVVEQAYKFCLLGLTNWQLAKHFGVSPDTVDYWQKTNEDFREALEQGREYADAEAAKMLFKVGMGQVEQPGIKFFKSRVTEKEYDADGKLIYETSYDKIIEQPYTKRYQPDTKALIKWLGVRNKATWGESIKVDHEHRHAHLVSGEIDVTSVMDMITDREAYTNEELKLLAKLGLQQKVEQAEQAQLSE
jgi:hypothetical protein